LFVGEPHLEQYPFFLSVYSIMIYTLYLSSENARQITANTQLGWTINWDNLFQKKNELYKTCKVKVDFRQTTLESTIAQGDAGWNYYNRSGYLGSNLSSGNQQPAFGATIQGTILTLVNPDSIVAWTADGTAAPIYSWSRVTGRTLDTEGVQILTPLGTNELQLSLLQYNLNNTSPRLFPTFTDQYQVLLQFELDDD
jgi:hypothetical protein